VHQDEELHAELMQAFQVYFKANQQWINTGTRRSGIKVRNALSEIRRICSLRREKIREWRHELDKAKAEKRAIQKATGEGNTNDT
jgi:hypothetical protein